MDKTDLISKLERRLAREKGARKQAEKILEVKALELFHVNEGLEEEVNRRTIELRQSEIKYRSIIENMQLGLLEVDTEERIVRAYPLFCSITGYSEELLLGKHAGKFLSFDDEYLEAAIKENNKRLEGEASVWEIRIRHADGHPIHMLVSGAPIMNVDGGVEGSIGIHYDISYQKALQEELEVALEKAEASQRAEKEFLTNMSHEIRTPLNVIIGMTELLRDTELNTDQQEYLGTLSRSADMLLDLISDILDISKIDAGVLQISEANFDLTHIMNSLARMFEVKLEERPISMKYEFNYNLNNYLIGDAKLLNQVLVNLLGNACKFTESGEVALDIHILNQREEDIEIRFSVSDTGIGISPEEQAEIFKQFRQANRGINRKYGGSGLGLAISSRIIKALGSELLLKSIKGEGSTFYFDLKYRVSEERVSGSKGQVKVISPVRPPKDPILVVEDNVLNQKYLLTILKKWKLPYDIAENGQVAIDKLKENRYSLCLMDIQMPILDGYKATQWIRKSSDQKNLIVIALSASTLGADIEKAGKMGFNDFLSKPFRPEDLNQVLVKYLGRGNDTPDLFLDQSTLDDLYQGDEDYKKDIFQLFIDLVPRDLNKISLSIQDRKKEELGLIAHRLKPNFHMVGLLEGERMMKNLETLAKQDGLWEDIIAIKSRLDELIEKAWPQIEEILHIK